MLENIGSALNQVKTLLTIVKSRADTINRFSTSGVPCALCFSFTLTASGQELMTTALVVFVDVSLSVRCSSNHSAIKICSMLFVSQWERLYETCTRAKGDIHVCLR